MLLDPVQDAAYPIAIDDYVSDVVYEVDPNDRLEGPRALAPYSNETEKVLVLVITPMDVDWSPTEVAPNPITVDEGPTVIAPIPSIVDPAP
jgi:hypothetical protein